ncbi:MAG: DUF4111 domain-containing protein [Candidatus Promineifilaceae bacterium]|nr:DUF4111 domain-containing protein [Candidatus Promineifilaceae bacterium]
MTPYPELNQLLDELVCRIQAILSSDFIGAYLQGSFAVGDADQHSDVDLTFVTQGELTADQVNRLQAMHGRIYDLPTPWAQHLEGSYFPCRILRERPRPETRLWYLDNGSRELVRSSHCNTRVVRWVLHEKGLMLAGPPPQELLDPVPTKELQQEILATINDWGAEILADPERFNNRFYQGFILLSYCRMWHDLTAGTVNSKRVGAEWAQKRLDPSWARLIGRAWDTRPDPARSVRDTADTADYERTLEFVRFVMGKSGAAEIS